ncbi:helix-turn-helix transcriptional regulator [Bradyrhizobium elkanii]|uniref:helix-turn-helix transcriptional regulator n=1 Tax=Bradyrhizobium elkanii TaxID=29448 RepID=UPI0009B890B8|nr:LuxR family transcriptional regulator [Bradyrhizobium elkanii]WLC11756.1 autoinducer binding domain-containing protein [Bradyrhizobium elkanii USDA 94]
MARDERWTLMSLPAAHAFPTADREALMGRFAVDLEQAGDLESALDALHQALSDLGFSSFAYGMASTPRAQDGSFTSPVVKTRAFPNRWDRHWSHLCDPYYRFCFTTTLPLKWIDVQTHERLSTGERACVDHLNDKNLHYGITIPMHMPNGSFAFVSAISESATKYETGSSPTVVNGLFALCHQFQNTSLRRWLWNQAADTKAWLSARERECLSLAAQGKTSDDIALILGLSCETVRSHMKRAIAHLNASNRPHAIAKAIQVRLIDMPFA